jgi:Fe-Mn family superoxide dismutase
MIELPNLPYDRDALAPHMSQETLDYHYGKHHKTYVDKTNSLIDGTDLANAPLDEIVRKAHERGETGLFNNAAQAWNHNLFWRIMRPGGGGEPSGKIGDAIKSAFGSYEAFKDQFKTAALGRFGSGWAWLVQDNGGLKITDTPNGMNPTAIGEKAIMGLDVWEHAYYLDFRNDRGSYVDAFLNHLVHWDEVESNMG